jgi:hypothetical protein
MGFEAAGGKTEKIPCAADLVVKSGTSCQGLECVDATDKADCCVAPQSCADGFELSELASGSKHACAAGKVLSRASCAGETCDITDADNCCEDPTASNNSGGSSDAFTVSLALQTVSFLVLTQ